VDPETGALIDVKEQQSTTLRTSAAAAPSLVLFDADLIATPASVDQIVALDSSGRSELTLLETTLPLVLGIVGGVALLAGIFLSRRPRGDVAVPDDVAPEAALADSRQAGGSERGRGSAELAGVVPGLDDEAAEAPEGDGPDGPASGPGR
jgi:hypothetical protein